MSLLDALLLAAILALGVWRLAAPEWAARPRIWAAAGTAVLGAIQFFVDGFTWQFMTGYAVVAATVAPWSPAGRATRILANLSLAVLLLAAVATWLVLPVPRLPTPSGPHPVGTHVFRWVDLRRSEPSTADPGDRRSVIVQAWYPAVAGVRGPGAPYLDGLGRLPDRVTLLPRFLFRRFGRVDTHAVVDAEVSEARRTWPGVLFSPGYGAPRGFYSGLAADLASRGYVVLMLDHPYEAAVTVLADGRVVGPAQPFARNDADATTYMAAQQRLRAADIGFVLDRLATSDGLGPLARRIDRDHVAAIGHSFGGAAAMLAAGLDPRLKAAANIDGTSYRAIAAEALNGPFLLLESDHRETKHGDRFNAGAADMVRRAGRGAWRFEILRANHYSFTDAPLFFSPPGRWLLALAIGGERGPVETERATADILEAFLSGPLTNRPANVAAAARRHSGIRLRQAIAGAPRDNRPAAS